MERVVRIVRAAGILECLQNVGLDALFLRATCHEVLVRQHGLVQHRVERLQFDLHDGPSADGLSCDHPE